MHFFGSVLATLNHILTGDLLWLERFQNHPSRFRRPRRVLRTFRHLNPWIRSRLAEFSQLTTARENLDQVIIGWIENDISEADYSDSIEYRDTRDNIDIGGISLNCLRIFLIIRPIIAVRSVHY